MMDLMEDQIALLQDNTIKMLHHLRISVHRIGYKCLSIAIPCYAINDTQSLSKETYPYVATRLSYTDWRGVERAIRTVILDAWLHRDADAWEDYFPNQKKVPTNKQFIAVLAEHLR